MSAESSNQRESLWVAMEHNNAPAAPLSPENQPSAVPEEQNTSSVHNPRAAVQKKQPWKSVWPSRGPPEVMRYYGFKKGEKMSVPGNAGDFFAHGDWNVEFDTAT